MRQNAKHWPRGPNHPHGRPRPGPPPRHAVRAGQEGAAPTKVHTHVMHADSPIRAKQQEPEQAAEPKQAHKDTPKSRHGLTQGSAGPAPPRGACAPPGCTHRASSATQGHQTTTSERRATHQGKGNSSRTRYGGTADTTHGRNCQYTPTPPTHLQNTHNQPPTTHTTQGNRHAS